MAANTPPLDLSRMLSEDMHSLRAQFEQIFRRPHNELDPANLPFELLMSKDDINDGMAVLTDLAGMDPAFQYAFKKTDRIVTEANQQFLTESEIDEWKDAIVEYRELEAAGFPAPIPSAFEQAVDKIEEEFARLPFIISLFVRRAHVRSRGHDFNRDLAFFYLTKTLKTLQACDALAELHYGEDAMSLARSIFENYLQLLHLIREPVAHAAWMKAHFGIHCGTHEYGVNKKGKTLYNSLVDKSSGNSVSPISRAAMASASPFDEDRELYSLLYNVLSSFAHPDPVMIGSYLTRNGFDAAQRVNERQAHALAYFLASLNLDAILHLGNHPRQPRRDAQVLLTHIRGRAANVFKEMNGRYAIIPPLANRISKIGQPWT